MKEITLSFTSEELLELAKQLYMAGHFMITYDDYENEELAKVITTKVCAAGFMYCNEEGHYCHGGLTENIFKLTDEATETCDEMVEAFASNAVMEYLPYALADNDFREKNGNMDDRVVLSNPILRKELVNMQTFYKNEIMFNGVENLRLVKKNT